MKRDKQDLKKLHSNKKFIANFKNLFAIRTFFNNSILTQEFEIDPNILEHIILTKEGKKLFKQLKKEKFQELEGHKLLFAIFLEFYSDELLIDVNKCNTEELKKLLNRHIVKGIIRFPWIYGRVLYDKYFYEFDGYDEKLNNEEVLRLLNNTPIGVFQLGNIIVGPFGILISPVERYIPPTTTVPLWHCSDPSCAAFHSVKLKNAITIYTDISIEIRKALSEIQNADWYQFYVELIYSEKYYYDTDKLKDIHALLISAFGNSEMKELLKAVIDLNKDFREILPNVKKLKGSSQNICDNIDRAECFQLLLLEEEKKIIELLEKLIENNTIYIPPTEIRNPHFWISGGMYDIYHQCSKLGIRSVSAMSNLCVVRLVKLIEKVHDDEMSKKDLEWKLMEYKKDTLKETIENYVLHEEPKNIIRDSLLYSPRQTEKTIKILYGNFKIPKTEKDIDLLVSKFLWKLGFDINIYPETLTNLFKKNNLLKSVVQNCGETYSVSEKDEVRSVAVNLFVLLEEVLEHSLSFITWTLLSDHYFTTKFNYNFEDARIFMCSKLNGHIIGSNEPLRFDATGNNTLFPLIEGFAALVDICDKLLLEDSNQYKRPANQIPHFHENDELSIFPFLHTFLLLDIKQSQYLEVKAILSELQKEFNKHGVLSVRNKLEHKERPKNNRDGFPDRNEIMTACDCINNVLKKIIESGIYPNVFLLKSKSTDRYNRNKYELEDYSNKSIVIKPIPQFSGNYLPRYKPPQVISSIITIGNSNELLRFKYEESSEYLKFWKDFPLKKDK